MNEATNKEWRGLAEYRRPLPRRQREVTGVLRMKGPMPGAEAFGHCTPDKVGALYW
jgi:hypothetical protein